MAQEAAPGAALLVALLALVVRGAAQSQGDASAMDDEGGLQQVGPFRYCVDRCQVNFWQAFCQLAAQHPDLDPGLVPAFAYMDSYMSPELPKHDGPAVRLMDRRLTDAFDDKRGLAMKLQAARVEGALAPSFLSAGDALQACPGDAGDLFFVKPGFASGGRGIRVLTREQLEAAARGEPGEALGAEDVVQRAVEDIETIDGRKFVLRFYLLIHDGALFLHRRGVVVVQSAAYVRGSVDFDVQVCHDSMHGGGERDFLRPLQEQPQAARWLEAIRKRVQEMRGVLTPLLDASTAESFSIIGGDALIESSGDAKLIELNFYPNLGSHNGVINAAVKQPMLRDVLSRVLLRASPPDFERLE